MMTSNFSLMLSNLHTDDDRLVMMLSILDPDKDQSPKHGFVFDVDESGGDGCSGLDISCGDDVQERETLYSVFQIFSIINEAASAARNRKRDGEGAQAVSHEYQKCLNGLRISPYPLCICKISYCQ